MPNLLTRALENPAEAEQHLQLRCRDWTTTDNDIVNMGVDAILYKGVQLAAKRYYDTVVQQNKTGKSPPFENDRSSREPGRINERQT